MDAITGLPMIGNNSSVGRHDENDSLLSQEIRSMMSDNGSGNAVESRQQKQKEDLEMYTDSESDSTGSDDSDINTKMRTAALKSKDEMNCIMFGFKIW